MLTCTDQLHLAEV
jgi:hypothetical protein